MNDTITLAMIVKNEADKLAACLESVKDQVDEIVIVDTGSGDSTLEVAARYTDKIFTFNWQGDFSAARNYSVAKSSGHWILYLDADESLLCTPGELRKTVMRDHKIEAYMLPLDYPINDSTGEYNRFLVLRLFKNTKDYFFSGRIHEQVMIQKKEAVGFAEDILIKHQAVPPKERNRKRGRNLRSLKEACALEPQNFFLHYYQGLEWLGLGKPDKALPFLKSAYDNLTDDHLHFRMPALRYLLICLNALGRFDETLCLGQEAALRYPDYTDIYYLTGLALEEKAAYNPAVKWFEEAVKCGVPPAIYTHMQGAGSFLAYYHMGYCWENIGRPDAARTCYEQALEANKLYHYPATGLFLIMLAHHGPNSAFEYLKIKGYLNHCSIALSVAELFFTYGYPGLAKRCLESCEISSNPTEEVLFHLGRYHIYSGNFQAGLLCLDRSPKNSQFSDPVQIHKSLALLLTGSLKECRDLALTMWKNIQLRCISRVLLDLCRSMEQRDRATGFMYGNQLLSCSLELFDYCRHYLPEQPGRDTGILTRAVSLLETFLRASPEGTQKLDQYLQNRINALWELFHYKFQTFGARVGMKE